MSEAAKKIVGQPMDRVDGRLKVTGSARYAAEFSVPNMVYGVLVQSGIAKGRARNIDTAAAQRAPGVITVITQANMPPVRRPSNPPSGDTVPLLDPQVRYSGQTLAVVVASTFEQAEHAAELVRIDYDVETPAVMMAARLKDAFTPQTGNRPSESKRGDYAAAMKTARRQLEQVYRTPTEHHNPLEPHATIATWQGAKLTVYDATQGVSNSSENLAELFGLEPDDIHVIDPFVGGGFGCKGQSWPHTPLAALAARAVGRPVKIVLTRRQMFTSNGHRPETRQATTLGADVDGKLAALSHHAHNHTSQSDEFVEPSGSPVGMLYSCANVEIEHKLVRLNVPAPTYMRAPGESSGSFSIETAMDELAAALGIDPIELRLRNYAEMDESTGHPFSSKSLRECYARGADAFGWAKRAPKPRSMRDGRWLVGYGMATATYPANYRPAGAKAIMLGDGTVHILCGTQDLGTGTYTILTQIAAETLGVSPQSVRVMIGDSRYPHAPTSGGSCSATSTGSAVQAAAQALRGRLISYATQDEASPLSNVKSSEIETSEGVLAAKNDPSKRVTYVDVMKRYGRRSVEQEAFARPGIERGPAAGGAPTGTEPADKGKGQAFSMHGFGAQFCEVRVDPELGIIRLARWTGAFALGKVLNEKTLKSQLEGGIVWGIGMGMQEETLMDHRFGRFVNTNLAEYHVPVNADVPPIEVILVPEEDKLVSPIGAKGAGEIGITGAAAAIGNAVYHATGKRIRELPITLDKLL
jgi:xanthine dehydrogenase YagR molybdenum-binding subunit